MTEQEIPPIEKTAYRINLTLMNTKDEIVNLTKAVQDLALLLEKKE